MKKTVTLLLGAILCGSLTLASCGKKVNEPLPEPTPAPAPAPDPAPTPDPAPAPKPDKEIGDKTGEYGPIKEKENIEEPAPVVEANTIVFRVISKQFRVAVLKGANIQVDGVEPIEIATGPKVNQNYTIKGDGLVTFKGDISNLIIDKGVIKEAYLSKAPQSLKSFTLYKTATKLVDLSEKTSIEQLRLRNLVGLKEVDLSKQTQLKSVELGKLDGDNSGDLTTVKLPEPSELEYVDISETGVNSININGNHPKLKVFLASASLVPEITLPNSPLIERIWARRSSRLRKVNLQNKANLKEVVLNECSAREVSITHAPQLKDGVLLNNNVKGGLFYFVERGVLNHQVTKLDLSYTGVTILGTDKVYDMNNVKELSLRGNTIVKFDPSAVGQKENDKMVTLLERLDIAQATITEEVFVKMIDELPYSKTNSSVLITSKTLSDEQLAKLSSKGWRVEKE